MSAAERASEASSAEQVNERVDFISFEPTALCISEQKQKLSTTNNGLFFIDLLNPLIHSLLAAEEGEGRSSG